MVQYVFKINQIEINLFLTNPSKYMIMLRYHEALENLRLKKKRRKINKNQDQEIIGLIQIVNSPQVIIDCLIYVNDYGELEKKKKDPTALKEISNTYGEKEQI